MNALHGLLLGLTIAGAGKICTAQVSSTLPSAPDEYTNIDSSPTSKNMAAPHPFHLDSAAISRAAVFIAPKSHKATTPRIVDSKFVLLNGIQLGMAVFDIELTQRCIADHHCREINPVMPSSHAGKLSVSLGLLGYGAATSYWLKKRGFKVWWLPLAGGTAIHSAGIVMGLENQ